MANKKSLFRLAALTLLWISFFLPWTGSLSVVRAFQESAAFLAIIGLAPQAGAVIGLAVLLALFPLAQTVALGRALASRQPARLDWVPSWLLSLGALMMLLFFLAQNTGDFLGLHLTWGFWMYASGLLASGLIEAAGQAGEAGQKRRQAVLALLAVAPLILGFASVLRYPWPKTIALVNATLIDGTGRAPVTGAVVVIRGGRIAAAGPKAEITIPQAAQQIDLQGANLLPGIIDAHVHNAYQSSYLRRWAQSGVTSVCDLGAPLPAFFSLSRDLLAPYPQLSRLAIAGPILTVPEGYPIAINHFPSLAVNSPEDAAQKTAFLSGQGVDVVKTALVAAVLPSLSQEELSAIVQAAHQHGRRVRVHQTDYRSLQMAVDAGVDVIDHSEAEWVTDALIQQMVEKQVVWVPTLSVTQAFFNIDTSPTIKRFVAAGGRVAMGTDAGYYDFLEIGLPVYELEYLARTGLDPMQIIVAATRNSAYACGIEDEVGTIAAGKSADLLVVRGDPLLDIHALEKPELVIRQGVVIFQQ